MNQRAAKLAGVMIALVGAIAVTVSFTPRPTVAAAFPDMTGHWAGVANSVSNNTVAMSGDFTGATSSKTFTGTLDVNAGSIELMYHVKGKVTSGGGVSANLIPITRHTKKITMKGTLSTHNGATDLEGTYKSSTDHGTISLIRAAP